MIHVTQKLIDAGAPGSPCRCPIALAARKQLQVKNLYVTGDGLTVTVEDGLGRSKDVTTQLPPEARQFIHDFDRGEPVEPFEFSVPDELIPYLQTAGEQA
jgi:hypothetical protein